MNEIRRWASERQLLSDQAAVAELTLASSDWLTAIEGRAGAAKTTTVGAIRQFAEEQGYAVRGFAPTTRAVKALSEAGISATTVASLLESQSSPANEREIWIVDESSLLPTRQVNRLLHKASEQDVGRVVFVGDQRQHHAIEAGRPIYQMQQAGMQVARLDTIRRQRDPQLRQAVSHAAKGEIAESLAILERRGDIREITDVAQRRKAIAREYLAAHEAGQRVLVVSPANEERRELNKAIRATLVVRGHVDAHGSEQAILVNRNLSGVQRALAYNYQEGDVVRFTRGSKHKVIPKDSYAHVQTIDRDSNLIGVQTGDGRRVE
jgi:ATP-dependent exoDNAse (exonuclease V) alpha subunit